MRKTKEQKDRLKEVKKALLGNLSLGEDENLKPGPDFYISRWGSPDGEFGTRLFGISVKRRDYLMTIDKETSVLYQAREVMKQIGRGITFLTVEKGCACIIKHVIFRPVVLIFEIIDDDEAVLLAYCGRDVLTYSSIRRAIKLFEQGLPRGLEAVGKSGLEYKRGKV